MGLSDLLNWYSLRSKVSSIFTPTSLCSNMDFSDRLSHLGQGDPELNTIPLHHRSTEITGTTPCLAPTILLVFSSHTNGGTLFPHLPQIWSLEANPPLFRSHYPFPGEGWGMQSHLEETFVTR